MSTATAQIGNRYVFAAMGTCLLMMASLLWIPTLLGAMAQGYGIETRMLGLLGSAEIFGFLAASIVGSFIAVDRMKPWVIAGAAMVIAANISLMLLAPNVPFLLMRPVASFGGGLAFAYALKICAMSAHPTRSFGIFTGMMSVLMLIGFQVGGRLMAARTGADGVTSADGAAEVARTIFMLYAGMAAAGALVFLGNQPTLPSSSAEGHGSSGGGKLAPAVFVGLAGIALSFMGQGCIFSFLQTMGVSHNFDVAGVANAMSAWAFVGVLGSFSVGLLPESVPRWVLIGIGLLVMLGGYYALYSPPSVLVYAIGCAIGGFYWNFILPLMLGLLARVDASGRGSVWGGSMSSMGSMLGPVIAGMLISGTNYMPVATTSIALTVAGFACVFLIERGRAVAG
jgi:predicted MFS family arabinose efflux permease